MSRLQTFNTKRIFDISSLSENGFPQFPGHNSQPENLQSAGRNGIGCKPRSGRLLPDIQIQSGDTSRMLSLAPASFRQMPHGIRGVLSVCPNGANAGGTPGRPSSSNPRRQAIRRKGILRLFYPSATGRQGRIGP